MARRRYYSSSSRRNYGYGRSSGSGRYRRDRRAEERHIELVSLGLILALFMLPLLFNQIISTPLTLILGGIILLGGAFAQSQRRFRVNPVTWVGGAAMLLFGIIEMQSGQMPLGGLLPILLAGGVILFSFISGEF